MQEFKHIIQKSGENNLKKQVKVLKMTMENNVEQWREMGKKAIVFIKNYIEFLLKTNN